MHSPPKIGEIILAAALSHAVASFFGTLLMFDAIKHSLLEKNQSGVHWFDVSCESPVAAAGEGMTYTCHKNLCTGHWCCPRDCGRFVDQLLVGVSLVHYCLEELSAYV